MDPYQRMNFNKHCQMVRYWFCRFYSSHTKYACHSLLHRTSSDHPQGFETFVIESCCARWMQTQSWMDRSGAAFPSVVARHVILRLHSCRSVDSLHPKNLFESLGRRERLPIFSCNHFCPVRFWRHMVKQTKANKTLPQPFPNRNFLAWQLNLQWKMENNLTVVTFFFRSLDPVQSWDSTTHDW